MTEVTRVRRASSKAKYKSFDEKFPNMPSYTRRAVVADALGIVSSYISNHKNWEALKPAERGEEPTLGFPEYYELTFYKQERNLKLIDKGIIEVKLFDGKTWDWHCFGIKNADARFISMLSNTRKILSPTIEKTRKGYRVRFSFSENKDLVQDDNPLSYRILAIDLGINAAATWCVMESDGTVHAKGVMHLSCEEDRLYHLMNRKRMYQAAGKKSRSIYRMVDAANKSLAVEMCREIMKVATLYNVDCIVFEHLDRPEKIKGRRYRERIHMWRSIDVQKRVELQAHRCGMRISRVCAWGTSKLAFDGSGTVIRGKNAGLSTYSLCRFQNGKVYNCDLSAAQNIGARFFLREYAKFEDAPEMPKTPQRTYSTLVSVVSILSQDTPITADKAA
jgi:hypothetical protein